MTNKTISKVDLLNIIDKLNAIINDLYDECEPVQASFKLGEVTEELENLIGD